jgi:uncharacterized protein (DUF433 family)
MTTFVATEIGRHHLDAAIAALPDEGTSDALIARYVRRDSQNPGRHSARVETEDVAPHVWALIGHLRGGGGIAQTAADYGLPEDAVLAAVAFYAKHRPYIDAVLLINEGFFSDWDAPDDGSA